MNKFKILLPIDFSDTSLNAYLYATKMAKELDAEITLLHVQMASFNDVEYNVTLPLAATDAQVVKELKYFAADYPKEKNIDLPKTELKFKATVGFPKYTIVQIAEEQGSDIIIMGVRDKKYIISKILGTTATYVSQKAPCPVLLIHKNTRYNPIESVLFAIDEKGAINQSIEKYDLLNRKLKAYTEFVHVNKDTKEKVQSAVAEIVDKLLEDHDPNYTFEIKTIEGPDVVASIIDYAVFSKADMVVMVHRNEGIWDSFYNGSSSIKLMEGFHLPIMIFNDTY